MSLCVLCGSLNTWVSAGFRGVCGDLGRYWMYWRTGKSVYQFQDTASTSTTGSTYWLSTQPYQYGFGVGSGHTVKGHLTEEGSHVSGETFVQVYNYEYRSHTAIYMRVNSPQAQNYRSYYFEVLISNVYEHVFVRTSASR